jgi:hypothetical protein
MASAAVIEAVKSRQQGVGGWTTTRVDYPNDTTTPPSDGSSFVEVDFPLAGSDQASLGAPGANKFRDTGVIRFIVNIKSGDGTELATQYADELADLFRAKVFQGVITYAPSPPVFLGVDGMYAAWSITVPYKFDHQE